MHNHLHLSFILNSSNTPSETPKLVHSTNIYLENMYRQVESKRHKYHK